MKIRLLKGLLLLGAFICFGAIQAQTVSGTVSDANGPLPGASVLVKGTTNGTQTDFDGNYTLNDVGSDATLVFSYIGFKTFETAVNGRTSISVTLEEDATALDEVVIIGYGQTTVKDATGSVAAVTSEDFNGGVITSPEQLIQGKTAGVNIQQNSGEPGAGISVNIRGSNSVRANNNPLFVVDGIPLLGANIDAQGSTSADGGGNDAEVGNPLSFLNPNDIESISILKDASATAIYGTRGANGVVIITTKSGRGGGTGGTWEFSSNLSVSTPVRQFDLLNREEYLEAIPQFGGSAAANDFGANTNWQDVVTRTAASTNQNLSYSQNYGSGNIRTTFGYQKQFGVVEKSEFERITGRVNWSQRFLDDKLRFSFQGSVARVNRDQPPTGPQAGFRGDILGAAYSANPTWPNSPTFQGAGTQINPANYLAESQIQTNTNRFLLNGAVEYDFTPELTGKINVGYDRSKSDNISVLSADLLSFNGVSGLGFGTFNTLENDNQTLEATLTYQKDFGNVSLNVVGGYAYQDFRTFGRSAQGRGFGTSDLDEMGRDLLATTKDAQATIENTDNLDQFLYDINSTNLDLFFNDPDNTSGTTPFGFSREVNALYVDLFDFTTELQSFFGRANVTINDKYIFTGTFRADGSSRFGENNQYGYFPSGAFAWQIAEEDFVGENVSTLKLRLSAGVTGNQDGLGPNDSRFVQQFPVNGIQFNQEIIRPGLIITAAPNPDLQWEPTTEFNVGVDFGFNNDRFNGSVDVYNRTTTDLLLLTPAAFPSNSATRFDNTDAEVVNKGVEVALNYDFIQTEDVTFSAAFNVAYNENEVQNFSIPIDAGPINGPGLSGAFAQRFQEGRSLFSYFMAVFEGFDSTGNPIYTDFDGNGVGDPDADRTFVGEDALPDWTSGLSLNLSIKNWDFSTYFQGQFGFSVYNNTANSFFNAGQLGTSRNVTQDVLTSGEDPGASTAVSTRFLESGDYVRLQNATIGYNWPLKDDSALKSLRLTLNGQNLFLITDYSGIDPEVSVATGSLNSSNLPTRGIDWSAFPNPLTVTFGINARF
ncbi:TonB-dependent receptor [Croceitalea sp. MTPC5]|uniref:SusC/RagA family TonB-linked outer membrane protein n=1 Tax=Croceitalea sp. MTPC5 TaxID=3056565 RepID=UPI002B3A45A6|nr:TonB-dependent receptor [Croceitalea sp. MTPC5]